MFPATPGYMHMQLHSQMLVSLEKEPTDHVAQQDDVIYLHLKPIGSDDNYLRTLNGFPQKEIHAPHLGLFMTFDFIVGTYIAHQDLPPNHFELLKKYPHLQIASNLFISTQAEPTEQILERNDYYYIQPLSARDDQLHQWHHLPIFIPMPPH